VHLGFAGLHIGIGPPSEGSIGAANAEPAPTTPTNSTNTLIAYFIISQFLLVGSPGSGHRDATDSSNDYFSNTTVFTVDGLAKLVVCGAGSSQPVNLTATIEYLGLAKRHFIYRENT
jgi:hypothetical protein